MRILLTVLVSLRLLGIFANLVRGEDGLRENSKFISKEPEENFIGLSRKLRSGDQGECKLEHCKVCSDDYQFCQVCENGYKLEDTGCVNKSSSSSESIGLVALILITVGLSVFSFVFCSLCFYFGRRYRHKYADSPNINGEHTKTASIDFETSPSDERSPSFSQRSPQNSNSEVINPNALRMELFKAMPSIIGASDLSENCSICFLTMKDKKLKVFSCEHLVHYKCCKEWIAAERTACPQCTTSIY